MIEDKRDWRTWHGNRDCPDFWRSVMRSLSDQQELTLLAIGKHRKRPKDIATELKLSERAVSSHLGKLSQLELVESRQSGRQVYYWVRQSDLLPILQERSSILFNHQQENA